MARTRKSKKTSNVVSLHSSASSSSLLSAVPGFGTSTTLDGPSMQVRMQNVVNGTLALVASARPIATQKAYNRKQQEFIQWCDDQTDLDVHTKHQVTGPKLLLFLKERVVCRPLRRKLGTAHELAQPKRALPTQLLAALDAASQGDTAALSLLDLQKPVPEHAVDYEEEDDDDDMEDEDAAGDSGGGLVPPSPSSSSSPASPPTQQQQQSGDKVIPAEQQQMLSASMIKLYVAAVVDLWRAQSQRGVNTASNPREGAVVMFLRLIETSEHRRKRAEYADRGAGTDLDSYSMEQFVQLSRFFIARSSEVALRDRLALFLSHFSILRGENMRALELADLHHTDLTGEGPSECFAVTMLIGQGKTNQSGKVRFSSFMRNRDVEICPVGTLGLYLFSRFHHSSEPVPDFHASSKWYDLKLVRSPKKPSERINYATHCKAIDAAFSSCKVLVTAKTHAARRAGAQFAEVGGAAASHIARAGGWNVSVMESAYLTNIPLEVSRAHAGFRREGGGFFLRREVAPPAALVEMVFPWAQKWLAAVESGLDENKAPVEKNIAARGFLRLLLRLRAVVLQDAVALRRQHPRWYLWNNVLFSTPEFLAYEKQLNSILDAPDTSQKDKLEATLPLIAERLDALVGSLQQHVNTKLGTMESSIASLVTDLSQAQRMWHQQLQDQQRQSLELQRATAQAALSLLTAANTTTSTVPSTSTTSTSLSIASNLDTLVSTPTSTSPAPLFSSASNTLALASSAPAPALPISNSVAGSTNACGLGFEQDRSIATCTDLWREYKSGIGGLPSVEAMDQKWGSRWRSVGKDAKHYRHRMVIIKAIKETMSSRCVSEERAVSLVEQARLALSAPKSLDKLSKGLAAKTILVAHT